MEIIEQAKCDISIANLPDDILLEIFFHLNAQCLIWHGCLTCKHWKSLINYSETLWKIKCLQTEDSLARKYIFYSKAEGNSWKKCYELHHSRNMIVNKWRRGVFSKPRDVLDLPAKVLCPLSAHTWGEIFQMELERCWTSRFYVHLPRYNISVLENHSSKRF